MKKVGQFLLCIVPFLFAFLVQIVTAIVVYIAYIIVKFIQYASQGVTDLSQVSISLTDAFVNDSLLAITAFGAMINIIIFGLWYRERTIEYKRVKLKRVLTPKTVLSFILLGVALQVTISYMLGFVLSINPEWSNDYSKIVESLGFGNTFISALYMILIAPIAEELIFRGVILDKGKKMLPFAAANILQALLFGIYHGNLFQGTYAFIIGLFLGVLCNHFKSLYASMFLHMMINLSGIILSKVQTNSFNFIEVGGMIIVSLVIIFFSTKILLQDHDQLEELELFVELDEIEV